jgi:hypothetical protein
MAKIQAADLSRRFGLNLPVPWAQPTLLLLDQACTDLFAAFKLTEGQQLGWMRGLVIRLETILYGGLTSKGLVRLNPAGLTHWTIVHELAHAWDFAAAMSLSRRMRRFTHSWGPVPLLHALYPEDRRFWYRVGAMPPPCGADKYFNAREDFAEAVAAYVYPDEASQKAAERGLGYAQFGYASFYATPRGQFIQTLADEIDKKP